VIAPAIARVWTIDLLLAPPALLAALAAGDEPYAWLLALPVAALLADMARDRRARITEALRLAHAYRTVDRKAHRDPLTGVGNRLAWDEAVALADAQHAEPVSVIIADLDGLKRANDERGHEVGDALICTAAEAIRSQVRESDLVARLGVRGVRLSVSLGWAATPDVPSVSEAKRVADTQMYAQKQTHLAARPA